MLVNAETVLHCFCARILGWGADREVAVEHAIRSIELATDYSAALSARSAANEARGVTAFHAARGGSLCVRAWRLPDDFSSMVALARNPGVAV